MKLETDNIELPMSNYSDVDNSAHLVLNEDFGCYNQEPKVFDDADLPASGTCLDLHVKVEIVEPYFKKEEPESSHVCDPTGIIVSNPVSLAAVPAAAAKYEPDTMDEESFYAFSVNNFDNVIFDEHFQFRGANFEESPRYGNDVCDVELSETLVEEPVKGEDVESSNRRKDVGVFNHDNGDPTAIPSTQKKTPSHIIECDLCDRTFNSKRYVFLSYNYLYRKLPLC